MYKIEKGIPLPTLKGLQYPLLDMKKGDSFVIPKAKQNSLGGTIRYYRARYKLQGTFTSRMKGNKLRIWRVK